MTPLNGPSEGGTVITVTGDNFGTPHEGEDVMQLSVTVADVPCDIISWQKEK